LRIFDEWDGEERQGETLFLKGGLKRRNGSTVKVEGKRVARAKNQKVLKRISVFFVLGDRVNSTANAKGRIFPNQEGVTGAWKDKIQRVATVRVLASRQLGWEGGRREEWGLSAALSSDDDDDGGGGERASRVNALSRNSKKSALASCSLFFCSLFSRSGPFRVRAAVCVLALFTCGKRTI